MYQTYQLFIAVHKSLDVSVGRLGRFHFPKGEYIYTGSAKRGFEARIRRHLAKEKKMRWHIDYLLSHPEVEITKVRRSKMGECELNQRSSGKVIVPRFGASDCQAGCGSHLKKWGK